MLEPWSTFQKALQMLRNKIYTAEIDDGLAISSFLFVHFSLRLGDHAIAKTQLKGMVMMLAKLGPEHMRICPITFNYRSSHHVNVENGKTDRLFYLRRFPRPCAP